MTSLMEAPWRPIASGMRCAMASRDASLASPLRSLRSAKGGRAQGASPRQGHRHESASRKIVAQMATARRMSQLAQRLGLDLANPLTRDVEVFPDLFQRVILAIAQAKAHLQHLTLALG